MHRNAEKRCNGPARESSRPGGRRYGIWKSQPRRGLNMNSRGCNPRDNGRNPCRPRRGRTTHDDGVVRPLRGRNLFFVPIRGLSTHGYSHSSPPGMKHAAQLLNLTRVGLGEEASFTVPQTSPPSSEEREKTACRKTIAQRYSHTG